MHTFHHLAAATRILAKACEVGASGTLLHAIGRPTAVDADGTCAGSLRHSPYESVALKLDIAPEV